MSRVLWVNPVGTDEFDVAIQAELERVKLEYAEMMADMARLGWYPSRPGGSAAPPEPELRAFGLEALLAPAAQTAEP